MIEERTGTNSQFQADRNDIPYRASHLAPLPPHAHASQPKSHQLSDAITPALRNTRAPPSHALFSHALERVITHTGSAPANRVFSNHQLQRAWQATLKIPPEAASLQVGKGQPEEHLVGSSSHSQCQG